MKKIPNKEVQLGNGKTNYENLVRELLNILPTGPDGKPMGFTRQEMKARERIDVVLDKVKEEKLEVIELEDQDAEKLKSIERGSTWNTRDKALLDFLDEIANL